MCVLVWLFDRVRQIPQLLSIIWNSNCSEADNKFCSPHNCTGGRTTFCFQHTVLEVWVYSTVHVCCVFCQGLSMYVCECKYVEESFVHACAEKAHVCHLHSSSVFGVQRKPEQTDLHVFPWIWKYWINSQTKKPTLGGRRTQIDHVIIYSVIQPHNIPAIIEMFRLGLFVYFTNSVFQESTQGIGLYYIISLCSEIWYNTDCTMYNHDYKGSCFSWLLKGIEESNCLSTLQFLMLFLVLMFRVSASAPNSDLMLLCSSVDFLLLCVGCKQINWGLRS